MSVSSPVVRDSEFDALGSKDFEDFIYLISHDVRNSVRALIELPQWIEEDLAESGVPLDGSVRANIDLMNRHTGRLDRMLVDLLTFSRVGRMQKVSQIDLDDALTEVLDQIRAPAGFRFVRALDCPSIMIGETDVMTLLTALVSNCVKHHDKVSGKIVITTHRDHDDVVLRVADDGPGIPEKFHNTVFGAMTTLRPRDEVEGSGMGLAITRKIAALYKGSVRVEAEEGLRGTTLEVRFPGHRKS